MESCASRYSNFPIFDRFLSKKYQGNWKYIFTKGIPDSTITNIEYNNGVQGHIFVSWLHPFKEHRIVAIGSEGMISFEDSLKDKPLKLYSKKINLENGVPEKIDGPVDQVTYANKMPLLAELEYFINHLGQEKPKIADVNHGFEVVKNSCGSK